ncbi:uncharacterized protein H6S33_004933 [Morchella sextelata]|uniref:uncharacterized protein n=1 Tax=Morchella sextelata TaxID=1174677 RepID=UPI001D054731|nr:uncharacterized protein H6S33_004933 [Morchella sextelata]KAH0604951.1 hypothetical protein H6S33_004933 [Morchella sextelata]
MKLDDRGTPTAGSPLGLITGGTVDFALDEQGPMDDLNFIDLVSDVFRDDHLIAKDDSRVPSLISNLIRLGEYGRKKFKITSNPVDIDRSVEALRIALSVAPLDHPRRSLLLVATMSSLSCVDEYSEGQSQYEARLAEMYDEISLNSFDLPLQSEQLAAKAFAKSYKYMRSRNMDDLAQGISLFQQATKALPPDDEEWRSRCLYSLGHLLVIKFQRSKSVADIDAAIDVLHEMAQIGSVSTKKRANSLGALGRAFCTRGVVLSEMSDVEQGIERHEEQLKLLTPDDPDRAQCLYSLSEVISWRYIRSKKPSDIAKSIRFVSETGLRLCLRNQTQITKRSRARSLDDIDPLIRTLRTIVKRTSIDDPSRGFHLRTCAQLFSVRREFEEDKKCPDSLSHAIELAEEAFILIPPDSDVKRVEESVYLSTLWLKHDVEIHGRFDLERAKEVYELNKQALRCEFASTSIRISAAQYASFVLYVTGLGHQIRSPASPAEEYLPLFEEAFEILEEGIALLRILSPQHLRRNERRELMQVAIGGLDDLGANAVGVGIYAGKTAARCLSTLELGRGVILGFSIDCRSTGNLQELQRTNPELLLKFNDLRSCMDSPIGAGICMGALDISTLGGIFEQSATREQLKRQRMNDSNELTKTLHKIRSLPGFEKFQLPPSYEDLIEIAKDGPIVVMICTGLRSDAIIATSSCIKSIPLPKLLHPDAIDRLQRLNTNIIPGGASTYRWRNEKMEHLLLWLWDAAVDSYIPTLKALSYAREKAFTFQASDSSLLIIAMPKTPAHSSLVSVDSEAGSVAGLAPEGVRTEILNSPSAKATLEKLPSFNAIHFACHGISDTKNALNSHFLLHRPNGDRTPDINKLTAGAVSNINIERAQIAYLSPCSTAKLEWKQHEDEALHIASTFQLAGFSHVLANMWQSDDGACLKVSTEFYRNLFDDELSGGVCGHRRVSAAFHCAVKKLRDEQPKLPLLWSPFIHTGA